jgi:hypothetical protein
MNRAVTYAPGAEYRRPVSAKESPPRSMAFSLGLSRRKVMETIKRISTGASVRRLTEAKIKDKLLLPFAGVRHAALQCCDGGKPEQRKQIQRSGFNFAQRLESMSWPICRSGNDGTGGVAVRGAFATF